MVTLTSDHFRRMEALVNDVNRINEKIAQDGAIADGLFVKMIGAVRKDLVQLLEQTGWMNDETLHMVKRIERAVTHGDQEGALSIVVETLGMIAGVVPPAPANH